MILAAYMVAGFMVASVYAVGMLRGRRDRLHKLGFLIPFTVAAIATPIQLFVGDTAARAIAKDQPVKFASMEYVEKTGTHQPEYLGGVYVDGEVRGAIKIPDLDSFLVDFSADTNVIGWESVPADERPPSPTLLHLAFDTMVGIGTGLMLLVTWFGLRWWRKRSLPESRWFWRAASLGGVGSVVALECGWIVTEVGRQPWIVYEVMRTEDAVTGASGLWLSLTIVVLLYAALGAGTVAALRAMSRRWREEGDDADTGVPYGPPPATGGT